MALIKKLEDIADAIRDKTETYDALTLAEMPSAIRSINTKARVESLTVTKNGEYEAVGVDGFNPVIVNVPDVIEAEPVIRELSITANGTYTVPNGVDGYNPITVDVPSGGVEDLPEKVFNITGDEGAYRFYKGSWDWFVERYGNKITTSGLINASHMFDGSKVTIVPFEMNCGDVGTNCESMFNATKITTAPYINGKVSNLTYIFYNCYYLNNIPEDWADRIDWSYMHTSSNGYLNSMFNGCYSLRKIPTNLTSRLHSKSTYSRAPYSYMYCYCYALDELKDIGVQENAFTYNAFTDTFNSCSRVKSMTFAVQEDGTPYTAQWKKQLIDLSRYFGYCINVDVILNYTNYNGITNDTYYGSIEENDSAYRQFKNDPNGWTTVPQYSRYNHDSAVETINSLPDTSAYLATQAGSTNTIKFLGKSGEYTDGGAINTLTAEEIAVATAKGWTVTYS